MRTFAMAVLASAVLAATGCASSPRLADARKLALYQSHAGEPVMSFRLFGSLTSWTPLGQNHLAVWTRPSEAWLLSVSGPCIELEYAQAIRLTDSMRQVRARFDRVVPVDLQGANRTMQVPCIIQTIQPLDTAAIRAGERANREQDAVVPQPSGT